MEFMPFIPDLEVFIDKTIKKCLLEYDLDANDTEAVLDDMEKAWPKSPPRSQEKHVLKDYNDNTENGRGTRGNNADESRFLESKLDNKCLDRVISNEARKSLDEQPVSDSRQGKILTNEKKESEAEGVEGSMSGSPSPDVNGGIAQTQKHPKLKSRLQQRYFEGTRNSEGYEDKTRAVSDESPDSEAFMHSNLDLLASAAKIHTETRRGFSPRREIETRRETEARRETETRGETQARRETETRAESQARRENETRGDNGDSRISIIPQLQEQPNIRFPTISSRRFSSSSGVDHEFSKHSPSVVGLRTSPSTQLVHHNNFVNGLVRPGTNFQSFSRTPRSASSACESRLNIPTERQPEENVTSNETAENSKNQLDHCSQSLRETVVVTRRAIPPPSDKRDLTCGQRQNHPGLISQRVLSGKASLEQPIFAAHDQPSSTPSYFLWFNQQHSFPASNSAMHEPVHPQMSRIATIIAEELEKDDEELPATSSGQATTSTKKTIPLNIQRVDTKEHLKSHLPFHSHRTVSNEQLHRFPHLTPPHVRPELSRHTIGRDESLVRTYSGTFSRILPAHSTKVGRGLISAILTDQVGRATNHKTSTTAVSYNGACTEDDEQPQDLSTKSRAIAGCGSQRERQHCPRSNPGSPMDHQNLPGSNPESPLIELGHRGYFSTPCSPLSTSVSAGHIESHPLRKSPSPSNSSDRECDYGFGNVLQRNPLKDSGRWEKKGQVHGLDMFSTAGVKDSKSLVEKRRLQTLRSVTNVSETSKKRRTE